jgi:hypothetical protein
MMQRDEWLFCSFVCGNIAMDVICESKEIKIGVRARKVRFPNAETLCVCCQQPPSLVLLLE